MRKNLKELSDGNFHNFYGRFVTHKFTKDPNPVRASVALILDLKDNEGNIMTDHIWISFPYEMTKKVVKDDIIYFSAKVNSYVKGYMGFNKKAYNKPKLNFDYQLSNINIINIKKEGNIS